jgi:putative two-component system response regulator
MDTILRKLKEDNDRLRRKVAMQTCQVLELQNAVISTLAEMVEFRDSNTGNHICATVKYLEALLSGMMNRGVYESELDQWDVEFLLPSAQLHDVGKIAISDSILNKPGKLTEEEFKIMKQHPAIGVMIIEGIESQTSESEFLTNAKIFAATHHEKWDGSGYPYGLSGENIPLLGRLMAVADVYDALVSKRAYKEPMPPPKAESIIMDGRGTHFDPMLIDVFEDVSGEFEDIAMGLYNRI